MRRAALTGLLLLAIAGCDEAAMSASSDRGTVVEAGGTKLRITKGETIDALADGPLTMLHVARADSKAIGPGDEAAARAAYAAYCADKGGPGVGGEGYFSQFGGTPVWKFGECGA
ncbi:hypothetical protein MLD63_05080 [Paracoccus sp. TK19116]|uniref:Uncharacterized protein n=1 Tax=Paracoccus albicereus TaxID=2922394 RepID=A0ABT1MQK6_9RHOB|nr:hypothetical protein [Paracoccus albicereus]MCQ0969801.1 hypothetical protein [Paracoccus albicereus]